MSTDQSLSDRATELYAAGQYAEAEPLFRTMLDNEPDNPQVLLLAGLCRRAQGDRDNALRLIRQSAEIDQSSAHSQFHLGQLLLEQQDTTGARQALEHCVTLNPNHILARTMLGYMALMEGRPDDAINSLKTALRVAPDHVPALSTLALALLKKGEVSEAHSMAQRAVKERPDDPGAQAAMGQCFLAQGHVAFAERCLRNALEKTPDNLELQANLANILRTDGRHAEAISYFSRVVRAGYGGAGLLVDMSQSLFAVGQKHDALKLLEQVYQGHPANESLTLLLARARFECSDIDGCEQLLQSANSDIPQVRILQARLAEARGDFEQAINLAAPLIDSDDRDIGDQARLIKGRRALAMRDREAAEAALAPLIEADGSSGSAALIMCDLYMALDDQVAAIKTLEKLLERGQPLPPHKARAHQILAGLLDAGGDFQQAGKHLLQAGWQPAPILRQLVTRRNDNLVKAWLAEPRPDWADLQPSDDLSAPVVVLGWPGSGRGPLLAALSSHDRVHLLQTDHGRQRAANLLMPATPAQLNELSPADVAQRRRNFHEYEVIVEDDAVIVESVWWENLNLPALARFFPGAVVIVPEVDTADLELTWRLAGYGDIEHMLELWHQEQALLDHFRGSLPLTFLSVSREQLLDQPAAALANICQSLALEYQPDMADQVKQSLDPNLFRPTGHWQHYQSILSSVNSRSTRH